MLDIVFYYDPTSLHARLSFGQLSQPLMGRSAQVRYKPALLGQPPGCAVGLHTPATELSERVAWLRLALASASALARGQSNRYVTEQVFEHVWSEAYGATPAVRLLALRALIEQHMLEREKPWPCPHWPESDEVTEQLRMNSKEAAALGLWAAPAMLVNGQALWGADAWPMWRTQGPSTSGHAPHAAGGPCR